MNEFLTSNDARYRLLRTIVQGVIGVIVANLDTLIGLTPTPAVVKPIIVAVIMACLSPIMAYIGEQDGHGDTADYDLDEYYDEFMEPMEEEDE